jgi:transcriptional regulator with XRE-family HTH domain
MTRYEIAQRSGVSESILSRLINGHGGITVSTLDKLAPVLGLRLETAQ